MLVRLLFLNNIPDIRCSDSNLFDVTKFVSFKIKNLLFASFECCICCLQNAGCRFTRTAATWKWLLVWVKLIWIFTSLGRVLTLWYNNVIFIYYQIFCWPWSEKGNERKGRRKKRRLNKHNMRKTKKGIILSRCSIKT